MEKDNSFDAMSGSHPAPNLKAQHDQQEYSGVFVSIAAYLDDEILLTINDCIHKATDPNRLSFGICWQYDPAIRNHQFFLEDLTVGHHLQVVSCEYSESQGLGWARSQAMQFCQGEKFCLQIDAHMRFIEGWDQILISNYHDLLQISEKPLISFLPPSYTRDHLNKSDIDFENVYDLDKINIPNITGIYEDLSFRYKENNGQHMGFRSKSVPVLDPSFIFTKGAWIHEVEQDPEMYYIGEEISLSLRSYTSGYDLFSPRQIVAWHKSNSEDKKKHYETHELSAVRELSKKSQENLSRLIRHEKEGKYGLGKVRSLKDYEDYAGVEFESGYIRDMEKKIPIHFPLFDHLEAKSKEMRLIQEGLMMHPSIELVTDPGEARHIILLQNHFSTPKSISEKFHDLKREFSEKLIFLDFSDWSSYVYDRGSFNWFLYFKRSVVAKVNDLELDNYDSLDLENMSYSAMYSYLAKTINQKRKIDVACLFDDAVIDSQYYRKGRGRVLTLLRNKSFGSRTTLFDTVSENGPIGRSTDCSVYFDTLRNTKIIVTCNPDKWEGDSRLWEALASGCLVFVDKMLTPTKNGLVDKKHVIYFDLSDDGLEKMVQQIHYYLDHEDEMDNIRRAGYDFVKSHHLSIHRIDQILDRIRWKTQSVH